MKMADDGAIRVTLKKQGKKGCEGAGNVKDVKLLLANHSFDLATDIKSKTYFRETSIGDHRNRSPEANDFKSVFGVSYIMRLSDVRSDQFYVVTFLRKFDSCIVDITT